MRAVIGVGESCKTLSDHLSGAKVLGMPRTRCMAALTRSLRAEMCVSDASIQPA